MKYLLMIDSDERACGARLPEDQKRGYEAYMAYTEALRGGSVPGLASASAHHHRHDGPRRNGKTQVLKHPYIETKEQIGGYYLIEAPDLDAALAS